MSELIKYKMINPNSDLNTNKLISDNKVVLHLSKNYRYFIACTNIINNEIHYYLLFGEKRFNPNAHKCYVTISNKTKIVLDKETIAHIKEISEVKGYFDLTYIETIDDYDVYEIE